MEDLSATVFARQGGPVGALCPSSQHAGNRPSDLSGAITAPGSPSQSVDEQYGYTGHGDVVESPPFTTSMSPDQADEDTDRSVLEPEEPPVIPNPYPKTTGPRWVRASGVKTEGMNDYG